MAWDPLRRTAVITFNRGGINHTVRRAKLRRDRWDFSFDVSLGRLLLTAVLLPAFNTAS